MPFEHRIPTAGNPRIKEYEAEAEQLFAAEGWWRQISDYGAVIFEFDSKDRLCAFTALDRIMGIQRTTGRGR